MGSSYVKKIQAGISRQDIKAADKAAKGDATCAPGTNCLATEALGEILKGDPSNPGISFPKSTQDLLDACRSAIQPAIEMVDAAQTAEALGSENGMFNISSRAARDIREAGTSIGQVPAELRNVWGDGSFIDAVEGHLKKIMPDDLSKFAENFGEIEGALAKAKEEMYNAVQGGKESLSNPLEKVAGQFANMATGGFKGATFTAANSQLQKLGGLPLESGATALLQTLQNVPSIQAAASGVDIESITDATAESILASVTNPADIETIRNVLGVPGKGGSAADFLNKAIASSGAINDGTFNKYVESFKGEFGALAQGAIDDLGDATEGLNIPTWVSGTGTPPDFSGKVSAGALEGLTSQFGGGSGENGELTFDDVMGSITGNKITYDEFGNEIKREDSPFQKALRNYGAALSKGSAKSAKVFNYVRDACYGDWTETKSSEDGGVLKGMGAEPSDIPDTSAGSFHLNGALEKLLPDMKAAAGDSSDATAAALELAAIMQKETDNWKKLGLSMAGDLEKKIGNVQALGGFVSSLSSKMSVGGAGSAADALGDMLSGATKSLANSGKFEKVLQNEVGVSSTNQITPKTS